MQGASLLQTTCRAKITTSSGEMISHTAPETRISECTKKQILKKKYQYTPQEGNKNARRAIFKEIVI